MIRTLKVIKKNSFHGDNVRDSHTVAAGGRKKHSLLPDEPENRNRQISTIRKERTRGMEKWKM